VELLERIESLAKSKIDSAALVDIQYDGQGNVSGYIASKNFRPSSNGASSYKIESVLADNLSPEQIGKILGIFPETLEEHAQRFGNSKNGDLGVISKYFHHKSGDHSFYDVFIDAVKIDSTFKSFFLVVNAGHNFSKCAEFEFPKEVTDDFARFGKSGYEGILALMKNRAIDQIRRHLVGLHIEESAQREKRGEDIYGYAYDKIEIGHFRPSVSTLSKEEGAMIRKNLDKLVDCNVKRELAKTVALIDMISIVEIDI
jgi:hypothetical protein